MPKEYTCDGSNINPSFEIRNIPLTAKSYVIIMNDINSEANRQKKLGSIEYSSSTSY